MHIGWRALVEKSNLTRERGEFKHIYKCMETQELVKLTMRPV